MSYEPDVFPEPRSYQGQLYRPLNTRPHTCRDGRATVLLAWQSECATCGEPFTFTTPLHARKFEPNRRCSRHKRPGRRAGAA